MSSARSAGTPQVVVPSAGETDPEFARVLSMADPSVVFDGPLTFAPPAGAASAEWLHAWEHWRDSLLANELARLLAAAADFASRGCAREMRDLDLALDASLEEGAKSRSRAVGRRLLARLASARGERWIDKFGQWTAADETPGHFPVIYAGEYARFHLPLRLLLPAYAYWEWTAALSARPPVQSSAIKFSRETEVLCRLAQSSLPPPHAAEYPPAAAIIR